MKKLILTLSIAIASYSSFAQNTFPGTGNVGIGTTNPVAKLDVVDDIPGNYSATSQQVVARFFNNPASVGSGVNGAFINLQTTSDGYGHNPVASIGVVGESYDSNNGSFVIATRDATGVGERMRVNSSGSVSIGITDPQGYNLQ